MPKSIVRGRRTAQPRPTANPPAASADAIADAQYLLNQCRALADVMTCVTTEMLDDTTIPRLGYVLDDILERVAVQLKVATGVRS